MCMLLSIGFIMITRLNYDKAAKQYLIAAAGIVLCLVIPIIIRKARSCRNGEFFTELSVSCRWR